MIRTGFITTKGSLVRDILYPKPTKFKFYRDSMIFIGIMFLCALLGFCCTIKYLIQTGYTVAEVVRKSLVLVTITVPPILPSAMTIGSVYAINRLKR